MSKENLVKDFEKKQKTYFKDNYLSKSKSSYVRRLRNKLINDELDKLDNYSKVLDIGCGPAILFENTLMKSMKYYALDIAESNLKEIEISNPDNEKIKYILSDLDTFSHETDFFDIIISSGSIEYTEFPEKVLKNMMTFLKNGGVLICSFPNKKSLYRQFDNLFYRKIKNIFDRIRGRKVNVYQRKLFSEEILRNQIFSEFTKVDSLYFARKFVLSPFDSLFLSLDYFLTKKHEEKRGRNSSKRSSEFILIVQK